MLADIFFEMKQRDMEIFLNRVVEICFALKASLRVIAKRAFFEHFIPE